MEYAANGTLNDVLKNQTEPIGKFSLTNSNNEGWALKIKWAMQLSNALSN